MVQTDIENKRLSYRTDLAHKAYMGVREMLMYNEILPGQN